GIGLVAGLGGRPLVTAHGTGARVGQQVDEDVAREKVEYVVAGGFDGERAFVRSRHPERFDGVNPERLDDGAESRHCADQTRSGDARSPISSARGESTTG